MNDYDPTLDEIVSAYVDGVATPDERSRVESDPALVERAATFRRLHDALATPPEPASVADRNTLIARALANTAESGATVHTLRSRRSATLGPIVAAAAVIAMFFGLGTLLVASQDNDGAGDEASTAAAPSRSEAMFDAMGGQGSGASTTIAGALAQGLAPTASETAKAVPVFLGAFADEAALRQAVLRAREATVTSAATTAPTRSSTDTASCPRTDPPGASVYAAELRGRPVTIVVTGTRTDVYDNATCVVTTLS